MIRRVPSRRGRAFRRVRGARPGTVYVYVLTIAGMVTALGMVAVGLADTSVARAGSSEDRAGAERRCRGAIDLAIERLRSHPDWRAEFGASPVVSLIEGGYHTVVYVTSRDGARVDKGAPRDLRLIATSTSDDGSNASWSVDLALETRAAALDTSDLTPADSVVLAEDPEGYWPVSEFAGTHVRDVVGSSHGESAVAMHLADSTEVEIPHRAWMELDGRASLSFWYIARSAKTNQPVLTKDSGLGGGWGLQVVHTTSDEIQVRGVARSLKDGQLDRSISASAKSGSWNHVALVWDGEDLYLFLNGTESNSANLGALFSGNESPFLLGASHAWPALKLDGEVAGLAVFDRALSKSDISALAGGVSDPHADRAALVTGFAPDPGGWARLVD